MNALAKTQCRYSRVTIAAALSLLVAHSSFAGPADSTASKAKEQELLKVLRSDAPAEQKAITCKKLTIYGTDDSVPALAPLLADEQLSSWARIALEAIPGPAADDALLKASGKLQGMLLVGVLNSIGVRHNPKTAGAALAKLNDADPQVASAAAVALGKIGGSKAAKALTRALPKAPVTVRPAMAEGCIRCAEGFLADGQTAAAMKLYDLVRSTELPQQRVLEATRGAILARKSAGIPLMVEQLQSADRERFRLGLRVARELAGNQATEALIAEFRRTSEVRQPLLLLALADRNDDAGLPLLVETGRKGQKASRLIAIGALERTGKVDALPALLEISIDPDQQISSAAASALARMPGTEVDSAILQRLPAMSGKSRQVLINLAARRGLGQALPAIVPSAADSDPGVRGAALQALGALGGNAEASELVGLLEKNQNPSDRADLETALVTLSGRLGTGCAQPVLPLAKSSDPALRTIGLHALASAGGADSLAGIVAATQDQDGSVQDEAVRTLSSWPNTWPEDEGVAEPLLSLAKTDTNATHQVLALRGYLQFLQGDRKLNSEEKVSRTEAVLPLLQRPEEKRSALAVIRELPGKPALRMLGTLAADSGVTDDACSAMLTLASKDDSGLSTEERQQALRTVLEKSSHDSAKKKAEAALAKLK